MSNKGKKNIYLCSACGHGFVSLDVDEGVTPFMTKCLNCGGMAQSLFYSAPQQALERFPAALEWYAPTAEEYKGLHPASASHVAKGGLLSREIKLP